MLIGTQGMPANFQISGFRGRRSSSYLAGIVLVCLSSLRAAPVNDLRAKNFKPRCGGSLLPTSWLAAGWSNWQNILGLRVRHFRIRVCRLAFRESANFDSIALDAEAGSGTANFLGYYFSLSALGGCESARRFLLVFLRFRSRPDLSLSISRPRTCRSWACQASRASRACR